MFRSNTGSESDSTGWISITDTYLLFIALLLTLAMAIATTNRQQQIDKTAAITELADANTTVARLTSRTRVLQEEIENLKEAKRKAELARMRAESTIASLDGRSGTQLLTKINEQAAKIEDLEASLAYSELRIEEQHDELTETRHQLTDIRSKFEALNRKYQALSQASRDAEAMTEKLLALQEERDELRAQIAKIDDLTNQIAALELAASLNAEEQDRRTEEQGQIRSQLLGLEGSLGKVVFLLDRSQTMGQSGRWDEAVNTISKWIEHLPIAEAAVIMFSGNTLEAVPSRGYADRRAGGLDALVTQLEDVRTGGSTNTYEAIEAAFRYDDLNTIILFTDGRPDGSRHGTSDVLELVVRERQRRLDAHGLDIKLHVVGVGDYFDQKTKDFLLELRNRGGGKFIGQ